MEHSSTKKMLLHILVGTAILSFGLYNVHSQSAITEGGILGATLLIQHWFHISPAITELVLMYFVMVWVYAFSGSVF